MRRYMFLFIKCLFDLIFSAICLVCLSPLMIIVVLVVFIEEPGPVVFKQKRI